MIATLGQALLREDAGFHPIQSLEAAVRQYGLLAARPDTAPYAPHALVAAARYLAAHAPTPRAANQARSDLAPYAPHALVAAARYLAAHAPTPRAANQTYMIAARLSRGENVFAE